jgi:hypothetical protein
VTIPATDRATLAFEMPQASARWKKGDILVFSECKPFEISAGEPCIVQYRRGKRSRSYLGIADPGDSTFKVQTGRGGNQTVPKDSIMATFREELRVARPERI